MPRATHRVPADVVAKDEQHVRRASANKTPEKHCSKAKAKIERKIIFMLDSPRIGIPLVGKDVTNSNSFPARAEAAVLPLDRGYRSRLKKIRTKASNTLLIAQRLDDVGLSPMMSAMTSSTPSTQAAGEKSAAGSTPTPVGPPARVPLFSAAAWSPLKVQLFASLYIATSVAQNRHLDSRGGRAVADEDADRRVEDPAGHDRPRAGVFEFADLPVLGFRRRPGRRFGSPAVAHRHASVDACRLGTAGRFDHQRAYFRMGIARPDIPGRNGHRRRRSGASGAFAGTRPTQRPGPGHQPEQHRTERRAGAGAGDFHHCHFAAPRPHGRRRLVPGDGGFFHLGHHRAGPLETPAATGRRAWRADVGRHSLRFPIYDSFPGQFAPSLSASSRSSSPPSSSGRRFR